MIKLTLKVSDTDSEMIELIGEGLSGYKILWAVCHMDFVYEDENFREALKNGEEIHAILINGQKED